MSTALLLLILSGSPSDLSLALTNLTPDTRNGAGKTALLLAAEFNPDPEVVRLLVARGWDLEARDDWGRTPLLAAARRNTAPVVEALLALGSNPRAQDADGRTAGDWAAGNERLRTLPVARALAEAVYR